MHVSTKYSQSNGDITINNYYHWRGDLVNTGGLGALMSASYLTNGQMFLAAFTFRLIEAKSKLTTVGQF